MTIEYTGRGDLQRSMELLWGTKEPPSRGPKPGLDIERIARAAIDVADAEGLAALSMRRVAGALGVTTMALYRYVPSKAELLDVMLDKAIGEIGNVNCAGGDWRTKLELHAREGWALYHRHPWILQVATPRPPMGPNVLGNYEASLQAVSDIGLTGKEMNAVVELVAEYVQGAARSSINAIQVARHTGISDEEWWGTQSPFLDRVFNPTRFPAITAIAEDGAFDEPEARRRTLANFEFGLQRVLDGIEVYVQSRSSNDGNRRAAR
jgi:AcrR family transcriptional regulator